MIQTDMLSHQWAISTSRFFIDKFILSLVNVVFSNLQLILNSNGSLLMLITGEHWEGKFELNR